jgi:long-chain acyl-CoA synthetase
MGVEQPKPRTLLDLLERSRSRYAERQALVLHGRDDRVCWTYADLAGHVDRFAAFIGERGVRPGDRVLLWAASQPWWAAVFFGCLKAGAVVVPLDARGAGDFTRRVADITRASLLVAGPEQLKGFKESALPVVSMDSLRELESSPAVPVEPVTVGEDDLVEIVFTSGTTGDPKGVMITHRNLISNVVSFEQYVPVLPHFKLLSVLPLSHLFEQATGLCYVLMFGVSAIYVRSLQPSAIFEALEAERITTMTVVPQILSLFYEGIEREVRRTGKESAWRILHRIAPRVPFSLRRHLFRAVHQRLGGHFEFFVSGGAYLDPALAQRWENMGIKVVQGYGLTECSPGVAGTTLARRKLDSVGKPLPCCEVRLSPDGEILVRGENVTSGYWDNPEATAAAFEDGWYRTGDIGEFDSEGNLYLKGRVKNIIVLANGLNVYPEDVENTLVQHPAVRDAVVIGLRRGDADVDVHAVLLMHEPAKAAEVVKDANRRLASHQHISGWTIWPDEDFPRTPTLKAKRAPIVERIGHAATL